MKKKLLPITLLAMLSLVACGGQTTETQTNEPTTQTETGPKEVTTLTITNREALTAEWHAEGADREVEFTTDFPINAGAEIGAGNLVVTSSDTKVIVANGTFISAIAEGKATVTVTYKGTISDSVEITVQAPLGAPDMKKSTIAELKAGDDKTGKFSYFIDYNVRGFKDYKSPEKYGNLFVDDTGTKDKADDLLIYGSTATASALTYDTAKRQYSFANPKDFIENEFTKNIKVGDTLNTVTIRSDYKDKMEGMSIIRGINGKYHANSVMTVKEIMELPEIQKDFAVQVTGKIKGLKDDNGTEYGNVYLTDLEDETKEMQVYGLTESTDALKVDGEKGNLYFKNPKNFLTGETTKALKPGDVITVTGVLGAFKGKNQISGYLNAPTLSFDKGQYGLEVGKELTLEAKLKYTEGEIKYTSANPEIATVEETTGKVKAIAEGFAEITATCGKLTGKTKIHSYVAKERPAPTEKALADVLADTTGNKKVAFQTKVKVAEFAGRDGVIEAATEFGGMNVTGLDGQNKVYVDGSSATSTAISFSAEWGDYSFSNPKDFLKNPKTAAIKAGDVLEVIALRNDYKENKQLLVVILTINGVNASTPTAKVTKVLDTGVIPTVENHALTNSIDFEKAKDLTIGDEWGNIEGADVKTYINAAVAEETNNIKDATGEKIAKGNSNASGPAFSQNNLGVIKMGSRKAAGILNLTMNEGKEVTRIAVLGLGWSEEDKISINGADAVEFVPATEDGTLTWLIFEVEATVNVKISFANRGCLAKIALYA